MKTWVSSTLHIDLSQPPYKVDTIFSILQMGKRKYEEAK